MTYLYEFKRADGTEVLIEYDYKEGGSDFFAGGCWHPGDDPEIEPVSVKDDDDKDIELTAEEWEKIEEAIYADPPEYDPLPDDVF